MRKKREREKKRKKDIEGEKWAKKRRKKEEGREGEGKRYVESRMNINMLEFPPVIASPLLFAHFRYTLGVCRA